MTFDDEIQVPEGWAPSSLGAVTHLVKDKVEPAAVPEDFPYVGLEHVEAHTMKLLGHGRASDVKSTKTRFTAGDVLYGKLRPYLNKVARPTFSGICSTDFLVFGDSTDLDRGFLAHYLNQLWVVGRAHHLSTGVELPRVDWQSLSSLPIVCDLRLKWPNQTLSTSGSTLLGARRGRATSRQMASANRT